jgi:LmbE family N-acetylglucosaminyl deacetylase
MKNVLVVGAHPDDLEWMAGGTVAQIIQNDGKVHLLTLTNGTWKDANGHPYRDKEVAIKEAENAAAILGYTLEHLDEPCLDIQFSDRLVTKVLDRIDKIKADTLICPWIDDLHHDHEITARITISASRKVPRVLMGMCNWYIFKTPFNPNFFVDISNTYAKKMEALECYVSEMNRIGPTWRKYHDNITSNYGLMVNTERAEGFITYKYRL